MFPPGAASGLRSRGLRMTSAAHCFCITAASLRPPEPTPPLFVIGAPTARPAPAVPPAARAGATRSGGRTMTGHGIRPDPRSARMGRARRRTPAGARRDRRAHHPCRATGVRRLGERPARAAGRTVRRRGTGHARRTRRPEPSRPSRRDPPASRGHPVERHPMPPAAPARAGRTPARPGRGSRPGGTAFGRVAAGNADVPVSGPPG